MKMNPAAPHPRCPLRVRPRKRPKSRRHWPPDPPSGRSLSARWKNGERGRERGGEIFGKRRMEGRKRAARRTDGDSEQASFCFRSLVRISKSQLFAATDPFNRHLPLPSCPPSPQSSSVRLALSLGACLKVRMCLRRRPPCCRRRRAHSLAPNRWITCCFLKSCLVLAEGRYFL